MGLFGAWKTAPDDTRSVTVALEAAKPTARIDDLSTSPTRSPAGGRVTAHCVIFNTGTVTGNFSVKFTVSGVGVRSYTISVAKDSEQDIVHSFTMPSTACSVKAEVFGEV